MRENQMMVKKPSTLSISNSAPKQIKNIISQSSKLSNSIYEPKSAKDVIL